MYNRIRTHNSETSSDSTFLIRRRGLCVPTSAAMIRGDFGELHDR